MDDGPVRLFAFVILFSLSAYFSGSEISLASVNKIRIANHAENGDKAARRVLYLLDNFDKALSTLLIGNNIVNTAIATLSTVCYIRHIQKCRGRFPILRCRCVLLSQRLPYSFYAR